jgi:bifunctional non-homologous end joining protein LigD
MFEEVKKLGLEGVIAKKRDAPYRAGRSSSWLKIKADRTDDFVVIGFTPPKGSRTGLGALQLGVYDGDRLVYAGRVGGGLSENELSAGREELEKLARATPPVTDAVDVPRGTVWVEPRLVCEVRYSMITDEGLLRHPVFLRFRDDKRPEECRRVGHAAEPEPAVTGEAIEPPERVVPFTNLKKVFWPDEGYTKGDLIEYYRAVSPFLLPYLADRPVVLTRFPDGISGKSFYQHNAPKFIPGWLRTERYWNDSDKKEVDYLILDDLESLLYAANLGSIPIHMWSSRAATISRPDWCVLDLDPKGAPFSHVVKLARMIRSLCDELALPAYVKTSGQAGLHVLVPVGRQLTHEQSRTLGELIARVIAEEAPDIATTVRAVSGRGGRVYLDYLQNGHGRTLVAPFSARPVPGAPVSTPLSWSEVGARLDPRRFTLRTVPARLAKSGKDPCAEVLTRTPDLAGALERLGARLRAAPTRE